MSNSREDNLRSLISRYEQRIFALALHLTGGGRDKAFDIASSSFAETASPAPAPGKKDESLASLARAVLEKSRGVEAIPRFDEQDFENLHPEERSGLQLIRRALHSLPFDAKALILLRDQLNLSYEGIAAVFRSSEADVRSRTIEARAQLRKQMEEVLRRAG